ncbi:MAG: hypothetical protein ACLFR1_06045 [Spirochaetia bacterium]
MKEKFFVLLISFLLCLVLFSCESTPENIEEEVYEEPEDLPEPETEGPETPSSEPEEELEEEPDMVVTENYAVERQVYEETFETIEALIYELNNTIRAGNFETWRTYLTEDYIEYYSRRDVLSELSDQPMLERYNIYLTSLRDYFDYVVVPSRSNARLDDIVFVDDTHVKAIMIINGSRSILYQLVKTEAGWKIDIW